MNAEFAEGVTDRGIYYQRHGEASSCPLVMIVGYGGTLATWTPAFLDRLSQITPLVVFDQRGSGKSAAVPDIETLTFESIAYDLQGILDEIGVNTTNILGYSMGGCVALEFFKKNPSRIEKLILQSTTGGGKLYQRADDDTIDRVNNPRGSTFEEIFFDFISLSMPASAIQQHRATLQAICDATKDPATPDEVLRQKLKEFRKFDASGYLNEIDCPVLVIHGNEDQLMPFQNALGLTEHIRNSKMLELNGCGHYPHVECSAGLIQGIASFLGRE